MFYRLVTGLDLLLRRHTHLFKLELKSKKQTFKEPALSTFLREMFRKTLVTFDL